MPTQADAWRWLGEQQSRPAVTGLKGNTTGGKAFCKAGLPESWVVGDKTGAGDYGTNDIAVIWLKITPAGISHPLTQPQQDAKPQEVLAAAAKAP